MVDTQNLSIYAGIILVSLTSAVALAWELNKAIWGGGDPQGLFGLAQFTHSNFKYFFPLGWGAVAWGYTKHPAITFGVIALTGLAGSTVI